QYQNTFNPYLFAMDRSGLRRGWTERRTMPNLHEPMPTGDGGPSRWVEPPAIGLGRVGEFRRRTPGVSGATNPAIRKGPRANGEARARSERLAVVAHERQVALGGEGRDGAARPQDE